MRFSSRRWSRCKTWTGVNFGRAVMGRSAKADNEAELHEREKDHRCNRGCGASSGADTLKGSQVTFTRDPS
jgi:hypothetical protein